MVVREEPQKLILKPILINLNPSAIAQPKSNPLTVHILPSPTTQFIPEAPAPKVEVISSALLMQYFKRLVAIVKTFATTSRKLGTAHIAWHNGWFGCWFRHGAPGP